MRVTVFGELSQVALRVIRDLAELQTTEHIYVVSRDPRQVDVFADEISMSHKISAGPYSDDHLRTCVESCNVVVSSDLEDSVADLVDTFSPGRVYISATGSVSGVEGLLALDSKARDQGVLVVPGTGFSPGLTNVMAAEAASRLDEVKRLRVAWMASADAGSGPLVDRMTMALAGNCVVFRDGQWERQANGREDEEVFFPPPIGWRKVRTVGGPETLTLPVLFDGIESVIVKGGVTEAAVDLMTRAASGMTNDRWVRLGGRLMPGLGMLSGKRQTWSAIRADAYGTKDGKTANVAVATLDQMTNMIASTILTTVLLAGELGDLRGVIPAERLVSPHRFLSQLSERGVRAALLKT
ncbi:MAG: hypothetical protein LC723_08895 [Actinobacteria bacterium]|nr:hypothetical protein [Actinomycetota bacterium]